MIISKDLKNVSFEYNEAEKVFTIINTHDGGAAELNKVEAFAFMRFLVRISQRNWLRKKPAQEVSPDSNDWNQVNLKPEQLEILNFNDE